MLYARQWSDAPEDVVQDAFVKLVAQTRPPDDPVAWLYRVVRNGAIDGAKLARRRQSRESAVARPVRWFVESAVEGLDAEAAVAALQQLPAEQREVIIARLWGGLSFEQIADVAGTSASTAFRRYEAGIDALRRALGVVCPDQSTKS
jgi:RNA polymerase sigma-70 factor (ECF subfamily)